ncbi:nuclear transport factor 2 family protein [Streptomyces sp. NPDC056231]|uniref:nuclear transport factor 2 family protein n=1 Tax=Streptomyces sp. NPDC056231 TaxID=3345755 RepID=UPI003AAB7684
MDAHSHDSHHIVQRYFQMSNTGDTSIAPEVLSSHWADHAHPEISGPADVQRSVTHIHASRPGLRFHIDTILGTDDLLSVIGGVGHESHPGIIDTHLIWLIRLNDGQMAEMWTYQRSVS